VFILQLPRETKNVAAVPVTLLIKHDQSWTGFSIFLLQKHKQDVFFGREL
jgi:hypothetical protein